VPWWYHTQWLGAPAVMTGVSAVYFFAYRRRPAYGPRLLCAAHRLAGVALYFGALAFWAIRPAYRPSFGWPYAALYLVSLALVVVAFIKFDGPKLVHMLQLPNVYAMYWSLFVGGMAVTGDWL
jgi:hypothetical protein